MLCQRACCSGSLTRQPMRSRLALPGLKLFVLLRARAREALPAGFLPKRTLRPAFHRCAPFARRCKACPLGLRIVRSDAACCPTQSKGAARGGGGPSRCRSRRSAAATAAERSALLSRISISLSSSRWRRKRDVVRERARYAPGERNRRLTLRRVLGNAGISARRWCAACRGLRDEG
jgi:hypothetical protein